jgi:hypothetical protein
MIQHGIGLIGTDLQILVSIDKQISMPLASFKISNVIKKFNPMPQADL